LDGRRAAAVEDEAYFLSCARYIERNPLTEGLVAEPWEYRWSSCRAYALGVQDDLLSYNVWYRDLGPDATRQQQRWREFLLGEDPHEEAIRHGDWIEGREAYRRRMQRAEARPARRHGRPCKPPPGQEGFFPEFYETSGDP
jgi:putative transposase